jgi:protein-tyrosine phosphatase
MKHETNNAAGSRRIPLEGCLNFRDLGGYRGEGGAEICRGRLYRSDDLSRLSPADIVHITALGIGVVVDLRSAEELDQAPNPLRGRPDFEYRHVPLLDGINSAPGGPPQIRSLPEMYKSLLSNAGSQIAEIFRALCGRGDRGAVFHCTAGKDRTGITAALILNLCGAADEDIIADYALTYENIRPFISEMIRRSREAGFDIPEHFFRSDPAAMRELLDFLKTAYGGAENYLLKAGLEPRDLREFKNSLLGGGPG